VLSVSLPKNCALSS
ncbi:hypothetical protein A2U01_0065916, partial [Trifolium medium]|nr:hypothetical protein [Trifolium medium]